MLGVFLVLCAPSRHFDNAGIWPLRFTGFRAPICVVLPNKVSAGPGDAGIVLTVNIACIDAVDEEDDLDDSSYVESDEDMSMSDEDDRGNS